MSFTFQPLYPRLTSPTSGAHYIRWWVGPRAWRSETSLNLPGIKRLFLSCPVRILVDLPTETHTSAAQPRSKCASVTQLVTQAVMSICGRYKLLRSIRVASFTDVQLFHLLSSTQFRQPFCNLSWPATNRSACLAISHDSLRHSHRLLQ